MDKKWLIFTLGFLTLLAIGFLFFPTKKSKPTQTSKLKKEELQIFKDKVYSDTIYPDAPSPFAEDAKLEDEAAFLWPSALESVKDEKHKEKVREEWRNFASLYPKNLYLLNEYKPALSKEQEEQIIAQMNAFTDAETIFARNLSVGKYAPVGVEPNPSNTPTVKPETQRMYFDYKIRELESRIELIEYAKQNKALDLEQEKMADKEIASWKKELEELKEVAKTVPNI